MAERKSIFTYHGGPMPENCAEQEALFGWVLTETKITQEASAALPAICALTFERDYELPGRQKIAELEERFHHSSKYTDYDLDLDISVTSHYRNAALIFLIVGGFISYLLIHFFLCLNFTIFSLILLAISFSILLKPFKNFINKNKRLKELHARAANRITVSDLEAEDILTQVAQIMRG